MSIKSNLVENRLISFHWGKLVAFGLLGASSIVTSFLLPNSLQQGMIPSVLLIGGIGVLGADLMGGVALLLKKKKEEYALLNQTDERGNTPLINALSIGNRKEALLLLGCDGIEVLHENKRGVSAKNFIPKNDKELWVAFRKAALRERIKKTTLRGRRAYLRRAYDAVKKHPEKILETLKRQGIKISSRIDEADKNQNRKSHNSVTLVNKVD